MTFVSTCIVITTVCHTCDSDIVEICLWNYLLSVDVTPLSKLVRCLWSACSFFYRRKCVGSRLRGEGSWPRTEHRGEGEECGEDATFKSQGTLTPALIKGIKNRVYFYENLKDYDLNNIVLSKSVLNVSGILHVSLHSHSWSIWNSGMLMERIQNGNINSFPFVKLNSVWPYLQLLWHPQQSACHITKVHCL